MTITLDGTEGIQIPDGKTLGSTSDSDSITIAAGGVTKIAFAATQSASSGANVLDDYEEGTYTPAISFGGGTTGIGYSTQVGFYTKIGRLCFVTMRVTLSSKGSSTGVAAVTLPFTSANISQPGAEPLNYGANFGMEENEITVGASQNAASGLFFATDGGSSLTEGTFNNNSDYQLSLVFMTA